MFNTCTIREKPDTRLAAYLGNAGAMKRARPDVIVAVGGCYAEAQRERIFERYPFVDVAFGPGSIPHLGEWIEAGGYAVARGRFGTHEHFAADLPIRGERRFQAWVQVSMGCNSVCAYCIVPAVRGREQSRRPGEIVAEVVRLAGERRARDHPARPERQLLGPRPGARPDARSSASSCERATPFRASSESASRARIRRTFANPSSPRLRSARACASTFTCPRSRARRVY